MLIKNSIKILFIDKSGTNIILITTIFDTFPLFDLDSCFSRWTSLSFYNNWITVFLISNDAIRSESFSNIEYIKSIVAVTLLIVLWEWKKRTCTTSCRLSLRNLLTGQKCELVDCMRKSCSWDEKRFSKLNINVLKQKYWGSYVLNFTLNWGWAMFLRRSYFLGNLSLNVLINMVLTKKNQVHGMKKDLAN